MVKGTEKEFFAIPENLKKLEGVEIGELPIPAKQELYRDERSAVVGAAAKCVEQKTPFSPDLQKLLKEFNVTQKEIIKSVIGVQLKRAFLGE